MSGIQALRERKTEISRAANEILAANGDKVWSAVDQKKFDDFMDEIERVSAQVTAHQKLLDEQAEALIPKLKDSAKEKTEARAAVELYMRKMTKDISAEEWQFIRNTMSTTTGSQGGYTVPSQVSSNLVDAMKDYGGMRRIASRLVTGTGVEFPFPTSDGTTEVGEIVAQNATAASQDPTFGTVPMSVYKFSSKVIAVPIELLQDSSVDIIAFVEKRIRDRIGRIQNQMFSIGTGTGQPFGVSVAASVGKTGATGQTTTIIYDDMVDMVDSVDVAYQAEGELTWNTSQTMRRVVRKLKDANGRPIWTPSYDAGATKGVPDLLMGYPVNINNDMPSPAANAASLTFGQHGRYVIRDVMDVTLFRFEDSAYIKNGQIGFLAWCRAGGNLTDTAAVKAYKQSAT